MCDDDSIICLIEALPMARSKRQPVIILVLLCLIKDDNLAKRAASSQSAYPPASHAWTTLRMKMITYQRSSFGTIDCGCTILVGRWGNGEACEVGSFQKQVI